MARLAETFPFDWRVEADRTAAMFYIYVLESLIAKKSYIGATDDLVRRLAEHNSGKSKFTSRYRPWELLYSESYNTREEAIKREKYLKSASGRRYLKSKVFS